MPPKHYLRARPLAEGETRTDGEPRVPELIWNGARITITDEQMAELAETGTLTLADAQLVWRGKDRQDWSDLVVNVPPLYIQEKIHPKAVIDDLKRRTAEKRGADTDAPDLFADFNGLQPDQRAEFYQHDQHWSNRMILGDSLQVMASLSERESLRGKVQCIYFDPPYGIKFNSNWQVSTQSRDVKDGKQTDISREPEQVKAFRDTWKDGIHSYLTYLRDRLTAMRELLTESGSIFVQIGDENVHRVRAVMDEVFGTDNFVAQIQLKKSGGATSEYLSGITDFVCWFSKSRSRLKYRSLYQADGSRRDDDYGLIEYEVDHWVTKAQAEEQSLKGKALQLITMTSQRQGRDTSELSAMGYPYVFRGKRFLPSKGRGWTTTEGGMARLGRASRIAPSGNNIRLKKYLDDAPGQVVTDFWDDLIAGAGRDKTYVVQTGVSVLQRCILMATDPGDLILDPTCGSGTTAYVAEQWGRRWITIDTSRVALALARTRLMAARYPWYMLADSREGRAKEAALTQRPPADTPVRNDIRQGFVYERVPHITLKSIA
ncbi:MAG: site-specific DNA-methyltransferase, partial [Mesorhizobium sp.]